MLDVKMLEDMPPGTMFATGEALDDEEGLHMAGKKERLHWVAIRGHGLLDWTIYCHFIGRIDWIAKHGNKVGLERNIRLCVPCDDESLAHYRR